MENEADNSKHRRRWFRLTPGHCLFALLVVDCLLPLSDRFCWFPFNQHKGWAVLLNLAAVGLAGAAGLLWWAAALLVRRRFQFTIRSLFAMVIAVAVPLNWFAMARQQAERQREVVAAVDKLQPGPAIRGDGAYYFEIDVTGSVKRGVVPIEPAWLERLLGRDFFGDVTIVVLAGSNITDAGLEPLQQLRHLQELDLCGTEITDAGLANLKGLAELDTLCLKNTKITGAGLENLKGLSRLQALDLTNTEINDDGLANLTRLSSLQELNLRQTPVTDAGLEHLKCLARLTFLAIDGTKITDAGLEHLTGLINLTTLWMGGPQVTDTGLQGLKRALPNCDIEPR